MSFLGLSKLAPEERKYTSAMVTQLLYALGVFASKIGCIASALAAWCVGFHYNNPLRCIAVIGLVLLGVAASWIGLTLEAILENPPDRSWFAMWISAVLISLGIFAISLTIRVVCEWLWTRVRSLVKNSPQKNNA